MSNNLGIAVLKIHSWERFVNKLNGTKQNKQNEGKEIKSTL